MISDNISETYNSLYLREIKADNASGYWIASPSAGSSSNLLCVYYDGIGEATYQRSTPSFRPIVCLKSNVQLIEASQAKKAQGIDFELK